jgi:hypothetical protein
MVEMISELPNVYSITTAAFLACKDSALALASLLPALK